MNNPFATRYIRPRSSQFRFFEGDLNSVVNSWNRSNRMGQIVGPHGSGKSTLMYSMMRNEVLACRNIKIVTLNNKLGNIRRESVLSNQSLTGNAEVLAIDGFEQLNWLAQAAILRYCRANELGLIVTVHSALRGLQIITKTNSDASTFWNLVQERQANQLPEFKVTKSEADLAYEINKGNMREAFLSLYDVIQKRESAMTRVVCTS